MKYLDRTKKYIHRFVKLRNNLCTLISRKFSCYYGDQAKERACFRLFHKSSHNDIVVPKIPIVLPLSVSLIGI